jgi:hypothetical protein
VGNQYPKEISRLRPFTIPIFSTVQPVSSWTGASGCSRWSDLDLALERLLIEPPLGTSNRFIRLDRSWLIDLAAIGHNFCIRTEGER